MPAFTACGQVFLEGADGDRAPTGRGGALRTQRAAAEIGVSTATLYNWRRQYGGVDTDAAKELKELREQNARLKRLLADAELEKDALREIARGKF
ncbi:transposase [Nocardia sp. CA-107356]|uniref:transposase n=1 Tax=Nocardia sp. CA-107356 TaxID=3239972 RepID=UPI003D8E62A2